jgi:hypothetical protein
MVKMAPKEVGFFQINHQALVIQVLQQDQDSIQGIPAILPLQVQNSILDIQEIQVFLEDQDLIPEILTIQVLLEETNSIQDTLAIPLFLQDQDSIQDILGIPLRKAQD